MFNTEYDMIRISIKMSVLDVNRQIKQDHVVKTGQITAQLTVLFTM